MSIGLTRDNLTFLHFISPKVVTINDNTVSIVGLRTDSDADKTDRCPLCMKTKY